MKNNNNLKKRRQKPNQSNERDQNRTGDKRDKQLNGQTDANRDKERWRRISRWKREKREEEGKRGKKGGWEKGTAQRRDEKDYQEEGEWEEREKER